MPSVRASWLAREIRERTVGVFPGGEIHRLRSWVAVKELSVSCVDFGVDFFVGVSTLGEEIAVMSGGERACAVAESFRVGLRAEKCDEKQLPKVEANTSAHDRYPFIE
jgi:hypothetical protein